MDTVTVQVTQGSTPDPRPMARHSHGDIVGVDFGQSGRFTDAKITGIHLTASKVRYDLEIIIFKNPEEFDDLITRIYNVDSVFIMTLEEWQASANAVKY